MNRHIFIRIVLALFIFLSLLVSNPPKTVLARDTTITFNVNSTDDRVDTNPGDGVCATIRPVRCTLRAATMEASAISTTVNTSVFIFLEPTTYTLTLKNNNIGIPLEAITNENVQIIIEGRNGIATIQGGAGWGNLIINTASNIISVSNTTLRNLIIQNGTTGVRGGGVFENITIRNNVSGGGITVTVPLSCLNCVISNNSINGDGGGLSVRAALTCTNCVISNNSASGNGGGIWMPIGNSGGGGSNVIIQNTIISDNQASLSGGGIYAATLGHPDSVNTLKVDKSTIARNQAGVDGGGIFIDGDIHSGATQFNLLTSTISANTAKGNGGGVTVMEGPSVIRDSTIAFNKSDVDSVGGGDGGGMFVADSERNLITNTILAGNDDLSSRIKHRDCSGSIESGGYNLLQSTQGCTLAGNLTGNILNQTPNLLPLDFYLGNEVTLTPPPGLTPTHAYTLNSLGIDAGNPAGCNSTTAQNGVSRHLNAQGGAGICDIGAFEFVGPDL